VPAAVQSPEDASGTKGRESMFNSVDGGALRDGMEDKIKQTCGCQNGHGSIFIFALRTQFWGEDRWAGGRNNKLGPKKRQCALELLGHLRVGNRQTW
jgi:hypothetical protein